MKCDFLTTAPNKPNQTNQQACAHVELDDVASRVPRLVGPAVQLQRLRVVDHHVPLVVAAQVGRVVQEDADPLRLPGVRPAVRQGQGADLDGKFFFKKKNQDIDFPKNSTCPHIVSIFKIPGLPEGRSCRTPGVLRPACGRTNIFFFGFLLSTFDSICQEGKNPHFHTSLPRTH